MILEALSGFEKSLLKGMAAAQGKSIQAAMVIEIIEEHHPWIEADMLTAIYDANPGDVLYDVSISMTQIDDDFVSQNIDYDQAKKELTELFGRNKEALQSL